jgi:hypothetical protein
MIRSIAIALTASLGFAAGPVFSQTSETPAELSQSQYTQDELRSFAVAMVDVQSISDKYMPQLEASPSEEEKRQIIDTANIEMITAVEARGLTTSKYQEILNEAKANPAVGRQVIQEVERLEGGSP